MASQIRDAKFFIGGRLVGVATQKKMMKQTNNGRIPTDGGDIVTIGKPSGSYSMDIAVPTDDNEVAALNDAMDNNEEIDVIYGPVGTSMYTSRCTIDSLELTGVTESGEQTGSVEFTMIDGKAKRSSFVSLTVTP